jgi:hypothetical protein
VVLVLRADEAHHRDINHSEDLQGGLEVFVALVVHRLDCGDAPAAPCAAASG